MNILFMLKRKNIQKFLKEESFDVSFGNHNPFNKGEVIQTSTTTIKLLVVKVYDHVWWRKFLIKCNILEPIYLTKVKQIENVDVSVKTNF